MTAGVYVIFSDMLAVEVRRNLLNAEAVSELSYKWQGNILVKELHMEETMTYTIVADSTTLLHTLHLTKLLVSQALQGVS